jgi:hypothetical protein
MNQIDELINTPHFSDLYTYSSGNKGPFKIDAKDMSLPINQFRRAVKKIKKTGNKKLTMEILIKRGNQ